MILKTRPSIFVKYHEDRLIIRDNDSVREAKMDSKQYNLLLAILSEFRGGSEFRLSKQNKDYLMILKFCLQHNLLYEVLNKEYPFSGLILEYFENRYHNHYSILDDFINKTFIFNNGPESFNSFFALNGLIRATDENHHIYFNHSIVEAPLNSICVYINNGKMGIFIKRDEVNYQSVVCIIDKITGNEGVLGEKIGPLILFQFITSFLYDKDFNENELVIVLQNAVTHRALLNETELQTFMHYEREISPIEDSLEFVRNMESLFKSELYFIKGINNESSSRKNQLLVSQYKVDFQGGFSFLSVGKNYMDAAKYGVTHSIEAYLNKKSSSQVKWVSDTDRYTYYMRGLASFIPESGDLVEIVNLSDEINKYISFIIETFTIEKVKVAVSFVIPDNLGTIHLLDQDNRLLYKSLLVSDWEKEILRGLCYVISNLANDINSDDFNHSLLTKTITLEDLIQESLDNESLYEAVLNNLEGREIREEIWLLQPLLGKSGVYVGRFSEER